MAEQSRPMPKVRPLAPLAEKIQDTIQAIESWGVPLIDLLIRIWIAKAFFWAGVLKTTDLEPTIWLYTFVHPVMGVAPETAAWLQMAAELACAPLLFLGLMSRLAAIPLLLFSALLHIAYPAVGDSLYWVLLLGALIVRGPGALSLDAKFAPSLFSSALPFSDVSLQLSRVLTNVGGPLYLLILRLWVAYMFFNVGWGIVQDWDATLAAYSDEYQLAGPLAGLVAGALAAASIGGAVPLAAGFVSRLSALVLMAATLVMQLAFAGSMETYLQHLILAYLIVVGPGRLSVDTALKPWLVRIFPNLSDDVAWLADAPRVVIVGAGFGGVAAAIGLHHARARVTLMDRRNYHLFQPLLYQVATASLSPSDVATPIRSLLRGRQYCQVVMGRVDDVDIERQEVISGERRIGYDYLVLATGAKHSYFGKDEWEPFAPGLKKIDDATDMRGDILLAFETAEMSADEVEQQRLLTFIIVGGGPTGVELAGAIAELARRGMEGEFRNIDPASARVILIQSAPRVLPAMPEQLSDKAKAALEDLGVEVRLGCRVEEIDDRGVVAGGVRIDAATVMWAAGVTASPAGRWLGAERDRAGRVIVGENLHAEGHANIFVIGDTASCTGVGGQPLPGLAAVAKQQGDYVAKVIRSQIEGRKHPGPFRYKDFGSMATIGREKAVADLRGVRLSGTVAWWLWCFVHVAFLADVRSRASVMLEWLWSYLTFSRRTRLITGAKD